MLLPLTSKAEAIELTKNADGKGKLDEAERRNQLIG
jgi:hypothetical protein